MKDPAVSDVVVAGSSRLGLWARAVRPRTLTIAVVPIFVGVVHAAVTFGRVAVLPVAAAAVSALAIQIATNLANDATDGERGLDRPVTRLGPIRVTGAHLMSGRDVRRGAVVATLVAALFGLVAVAAGGVPILLIGLASLLAAWAYSNGPCPISATPFGELFVVAYFGVAAVVGIEWLAAGTSAGEAGLLGVAVGLPAAAVLTVNNHRDRVQDIGNGRRTLAILLGVTGARRLYAAEMIGAALLAAAILAPRTALGAALVAATALPAAVLARRMARLPIGRELNGRLAATAGFQLLLAAAIAVALVVGGA